MMILQFGEHFKLLTLQEWLRSPLSFKKFIFHFFDKSMIILQFGEHFKLLTLQEWLRKEVMKYIVICMV